MGLNNFQNITDKEINSIDLRSEEVKEIMGHIPNRLIRYGITIIAFIVCLLFTFSFFFRYPDVISGSFYLQTTNPPAFLLARSSGKLQKMFVSDKDRVKKGDLLAIIENSTSSGGYIFLEHFSETDFDSLLTTQTLPEWNKASGTFRMGELQSAFSNVLKVVSEFQVLVNIDYFEEKRKAIDDRISDLQERAELLHMEISASTKSFAIDKKVLHRDSLLFTSGVIAEAEYEDSRKEFISREKELVNSRLNLSSVKLSLSELKQELLELSLTEQQELSQKKQAIKVAFDDLKGAVSEWETKYCLISPINGTIAFSGIWEENQNVSAGQLVMTVLPGQNTRLVSKIIIPLQNAGKVKAGQAVNLKFADFPYQEFGMVTARLDAISSVPDSAYIGTALLSDTLITNYMKQLPFKQNMQGAAEIITEDISLAERLIFPLKAILKANLR